MPTKHRAEIAKMKMTGWHYFPFDVVDWLTSADVLRMTLADRGAYITFLAVQWRDGYVDADDRLAAKQSGVDSRSVTRWMQRWSHLFPISVLSRNHRVNVKLNEIAVEKGNPKAQGGTEERRVEESREEESLKQVSQSVSCITDDELKTYSSQAYTFFKAISPNTPPTAEALGHCQSLVSDDDAQLARVIAMLEWNRVHKPGALRFRSAQQMVKAVESKTRTFINEYDTHIFETCPKCKPLGMKHWRITEEIAKNRADEEANGAQAKELMRELKQKAAIAGDRERNPGSYPKETR
jgi:hypothetical protein